MRRKGKRGPGYLNEQSLLPQSLMGLIGPGRFNLSSSVARVGLRNGLSGHRIYVHDHLVSGTRPKALLGERPRVSSAPHYEKADEHA